MKNIFHQNHAIGSRTASVGSRRQLFGARLRSASELSSSSATQHDVSGSNHFKHDVTGSSQLKHHDISGSSQLKHDVTGSYPFKHHDVIGKYPFKFDAIGGYPFKNTGLRPGHGLGYSYALLSDGYMGSHSSLGSEDTIRNHGDLLHNDVMHGNTLYGDLNDTGHNSEYLDYDHSYKNSHQYRHVSFIDYEVIFGRYLCVVNS